MKKAIDDWTQPLIERWRGGGGEFFFFFDASLWAQTNQRWRKGVLKTNKRERDTHLPPTKKENKNYTIRFFRIYVSLSLQNFVSILNRQNAFYRRAKERKKNGYARTF